MPHDTDGHTTIYNVARFATPNKFLAVRLAYTLATAFIRDIGGDCKQEGMLPLQEAKL